MIANFFGASSMFVQGSNPYELELINAIKLINKAFLNFLHYAKIIFISYSFNEIIFLILSFASSYSVNKKDSKFLSNYLKFILFLFFIIFIFSVRPSPNYLIYFIPFIYLFYNYSFAKLNSKYFFNCLIILFILTNFFNGMNLVKTKKYNSLEDIICNEHALKNNSYFYDRMRLEIFPFACKKNFDH